MVYTILERYQNEIYFVKKPLKIEFLCFFETPNTRILCRTFLKKQSGYGYQYVKGLNHLLGQTLF